MFCKSLGLSTNTIGYIEHGRVPGVEVLEKIARGLSLSPCFLAYGVEAGVVLPPGEPLRCAALGERLREARELAGLSVNGLAKLADLSHTAVGNIEARRVLPGVDVAERLASALRVSPCWLAFGEGEPSGPRFPPPLRRTRPTPPRRARRRAPAKAAR